jgi:hypothetical protein
MTSVGRRPSLVLTFTRDVTFVQPGYPISSTPKTLSRQKNACTILSETYLKMYTSMNDKHKEGSIKMAVKERECQTAGESCPVRVALLAFRVPPHCLLSVEINVYCRSATATGVNILRRMRMYWQWILIMTVVIWDVSLSGALDRHKSSCVAWCLPFQVVRVYTLQMGQAGVLRIFLRKEESLHWTLPIPSKFW